MTDLHKDEWDARDRALADVHETLVATGVLLPLSPGSDEARRWVRCDLASYAENRLGEAADPLELDRSTRERWAATARRACPGARVEGHTPLAYTKRRMWRSLKALRRVVERELR